MRLHVLTAALAGAATAAVPPSEAGSLPACGFRCFGNMLDLSVGLGCPTVADGNADAFCLCQKKNFGYGIRDCSRQSCPPEHVPAVINYGVNYCQAAIASAAQLGKVTDTAAPAAVTALTAIPEPPSLPPPTTTLSATVPAGVVKTFTAGDKTWTTTEPASVSVTATVVTDKNENATPTSTSDVRGQNKDVNESTSTSTISTTSTLITQLKGAETTATETNHEAEVSTTATATPTEEATVISQGAAAPMLTGFVNAPLAIAAAAFLVL